MLENQIVPVTIEAKTEVAVNKIKEMATEVWVDVKARWDGANMTERIAESLNGLGSRVVEGLIAGMGTLAPVVVSGMITALKTSFSNAWSSITDLFNGEGSWSSVVSSLLVLGGAVAGVTTIVMTVGRPLVSLASAALSAARALTSIGRGRNNDDGGRGNNGGGNIVTGKQIGRAHV